MKKLVGTALVALLAVSSIAFAETSSAMVGDWLYIAQIDPFTDEDSSFISVDPTEAPFLAEDDFLSIGCIPGLATAYGVNVGFVGSNYIGDRLSEVTYRVDSKPAVTQQWSAHDQYLTPQPAFAKALIDQMLGGEKLAFRYRAYSSTLTYIFPISGLREAIQKLGCYTGTL